MPCYEPVDLSAACNAGLDVLGDEPGDVPLGRVDLRGLPFLIGPDQRQIVHGPAVPRTAFGKILMCLARPPEELPDRRTR